MFFLRLMGGLLLVGALAFVILDAKLSFGGDGGISITTIDDVWGAIQPQKVLAHEHPQPWFWDTLVKPLLRAPAALVLAFVGYAFWRAARAARAPTFDRIAGGAAKASPGSELATALSTCRGAFVSIAIFSAVSNVLLLTGSLFMLEIYDRVLPSRSIPTLVALSLLVGVLFTALGILDFIRGRLLVRIGTTLDEALSARVYDTIVRLPLRMGSRGDNLLPLRDLDSVRSFLSSLGPTALFDLPWLPFYLGIVFAFHTLLGMTALVGAILLVLLTLLTEALTRGPTKRATDFAASRHRLADASRRNAEVVMAMGLTDRLTRQWQEANRQYIASHGRASDVGGGLGAISKVLRLMLQSAVLGVGAYLVIQQEATAGIIIAGAILAARALAPVDLAIAHWRGFVAARQSWQRLKKLLALLPEQQSPMALPAPDSSLTVENVSVVPPGDQKVVVHDISFTLKRGQGLGVIGPSASGKSSLARTIVGAWLPARGKIRLDGASIDQWTPEALGRHIGYLPQDVELFAGTVAQNIARFDPDPDAELIIRAARAADMHDIIVHLPQGYDTQIGEGGAALSAGQRQRIGLARALYGEPFLVVLDEPDANLDSDGIFALAKAILGIRTLGSIVIVVAHRPNVLTNLDFLLVLNNGRVAAFGPKDEVARKLRLATPGLEPLKVVKDGNKAGQG